MINSLAIALTRVTIFWYVVGVLFFFMGAPSWAEKAMARLQHYPGIPEMEMHGLGTAAQVQWALLSYWSVPVVLLWAISLAIGALYIQVAYKRKDKVAKAKLAPVGEFWSVKVKSYSLGFLPQPVVPRGKGDKVAIVEPGHSEKGRTNVEVQGVILDAVNMMTVPERQLAEELLHLLFTYPDHYAGLGHGVGLMEHTLNVAEIAASKCTPEFRLPFLAALAHDIGKIITFQFDKESNEWIRKGFHSREGARMLVTLPALQKLPVMHQRALLLAIKYDHSPSKIPTLSGDSEASMLAVRIMAALAQSDKAATAEEKDRHLERLEPEDIVWKDFVDNLREAPLVTRNGKPGQANQVNNPPDSPYLIIYEGPWRDSAVMRLPPEVAAALDLKRRDHGKVAKYTRILAEILRKHDLLVEEHDGMKVSEANPLWDIQSGSGEKGKVFRGTLVLKAGPLWKKLNYRMGMKSPYPVQLLKPNTDAVAAYANKDLPAGPVTADSMDLGEGKVDLTQVGLSAEKGKAKVSPRRPSSVFHSTSSASVATFNKGAGVSATKPSMPAPAETGKKLDEASAIPVITAPSEIRAEDVGADTLLDGDTRITHSPVETLATETTVPISHATGETEEEEYAAYLASLTESATQHEDTPEMALSDSASSMTALAMLSQYTGPQQDEAPEPEEDANTERSAPSAVATQDVSRELPSVAVSTPSRPVVGLSRSEQREGLAIADGNACTVYPHLAIGDKYYTEHAMLVKSGKMAAGTKWAEGKGAVPVPGEVVVPTKGALAAPTVTRDVSRPKQLSTVPAERKTAEAAPARNHNAVKGPGSTGPVVRRPTGPQRPRPVNK